MGGPKNAPNEGHSSPAPVGLFIGVFVVLGRRLRLGGGDPRGRDGGVRRELAAGMTSAPTRCVTDGPGLANVSGTEFIDGG